jgi:hypothetical protein
MEPLTLSVRSVSEKFCLGSRALCAAILQQGAIVVKENPNEAWSEHRAWPNAQGREREV